MSEERKSIGAGKLSKVPDKRLRLAIGEGAVKTEHLAEGAVTPGKISSDFIGYVTKDVQNQIDSIQIGGWAISNEFGNDSHIGISQKTLTEALNKIWAKLEDITGEAMQGFSMTVSPDYFVSEEPCPVHITVNTVDAIGVFEKIAFYANGELIVEQENVDYFEFDTEISETTVIKCEAKILGVEYVQQKIVTHYNSFWLGAGQSYVEIMDNSHIIPITNGMKGNYDIEVNQGDHIIIVVGESLRSGFMRADMGGIEIPFIESSTTVDEKSYRVFTSVNAYNSGIYNIDVNS